MKRPLKMESGKGFSLVEIMVGMLIGMLGVLVIFQVFAVSEGQKRTTTSGGDAQQNGALGLYAIERDLRMAGYGTNDATIQGCTVRAYSTNLGAPGTFTISLAPAVITANAATAPDSIAIFYANSNLMMGQVGLTKTMLLSDEPLKVTNRFGFSPGDLIVVAQTLPAPALDCTLMEVTQLPTVANQTDDLVHQNGNYINNLGASVQATYNKPGGQGVLYSLYDPLAKTGGRIFNLGSTPVANTYAIQNSALTVTAGLTAGAPLAIADGIVQMKAQYGKDTNNDGAVDTYDTTQPATAAAWTQVIAVRIALVARSGQREKPNATTGLCDTTTAFPTWAGGTLDLSANAGLAAGDDWKCYRYKTFETTVPLHNVIWMHPS